MTIGEAGVDVIVPCYNYGRFLDRSVGSVLAETGFPVRVLIIDDASTDGSVDDARRIAASDPRVDLLVHAQNMGHIATYNEGIDWVRSKYMLLLSADDIVTPGALGRAVALMETDPRIAFTYGKAATFTDEATIAPLIAAMSGTTIPATRRAGDAFVRSLCEKPANPIDTATAVVRSSVQMAAGGYRADLPHAGDFEMWLRLALHGDVGVIDGLQAFTRLHARNMRHGYSVDRQIGDFRQRHLTFQIFFEAAQGRMPEVDALRRTALRRLAEEVLWAASRAIEEDDLDIARRLADLATEIDPGIHRTGMGLRHAVKRMLGPRWLRQVQRLRGQAADPMAPSPRRDSSVDR